MGAGSITRLLPHFFVTSQFLCLISIPTPIGQSSGSQAIEMGKILTSERMEKLGAVLVTIIAILIGFYIIGKSACMSAYDLCKQRNFAGTIVIGQNFTSVYIANNESGFVLNCSEFYRDVGDCDFLRYVKWCEKNK